MYNGNYGTCAVWSKDKDLQSITDAILRATDSFDTVCDTSNRTKMLVMWNCVTLPEVIDKMEWRYASIMKYINWYDSIVRYIQMIRTDIPSLYSNFISNPESIEGKLFIELLSILWDFDTFIQSVSEDELKELDIESSSFQWNDIIEWFSSIVNPVFTGILRDWVERA